MKTLQVTLPEDVERTLDVQMRAAGFDDLSLYLQALLDADRRRLAQERLEENLREGFASETFYLADEKFFRDLRAELGQRIRERESTHATE
jgi:hypothetical protein